jgi:hypothetical protein
VDIVDRAVAAADAMADEAVEDDKEEDEVHLRRRRKTATYPRSVDRLHHCLEEEQRQCIPQIPSNDTTIGITVSHVDLTWKMDIHLQHAHKTGESRGTRRDAPDRMYSSTLRPDTPHRSRDSTRISCLRVSDR